MKFEDVKLNGKYRVIANRSEHDFEIGDIIQVVAINEENIILAESWTKPWRGEWAIKPEEMKPINETKRDFPNYRMMVEDLLDFIEDQHEGTGQMMYNEIRQLYGYPYEWTRKR